MSRKLIGVVGAGNVGATLAFEIARLELGDVTTVDVIEGMPAGKALDMGQAGATIGFDSKLVGKTDDYDALEGADLVVVTAGLARKPGQDRMDLLRKNAAIVGGVIDRIAAMAPEAVIIMVSNPLDVMTYLGLKKSKFPKSRVFGMAGVLDSARFEFFLAQEIGCSVRDVRAMVLGGHGDSMVPITRYASVNGVPVTELISKEKLDAIVDRTRKGGAEIVNLLKTGSAYYAPACSVATMVAAVLRDEHRILPACAWCEGEYDLRDVCVGVPCVLSANGVEKIIQLPLTEPERKMLKKSADSVAEGQKELDSILASMVG